MITRRVLQCLCVVFASAALATSASATLLAPGSGSLPITLEAGGVGETKVYDSGLVNWAGVLGKFGGKIEEAVYKDNGTGDLSFYYQFNNAAGSKASVDRMTVDSFTVGAAGALVDSAQITAAFGPFVASTAAVGPGTTDRSDVPSDNGATIGYGSPVAAWVKAGKESQIVVVRTSAKLFDLNGTVQFIDGDVATVQGLAQAVPEMGTVVSFALLFGLGGFAMLRTRRRSARLDAAV